VFEEKNENETSVEKKIRMGCNEDFNRKKRARLLATTTEHSESKRIN